MDIGYREYVAVLEHELHEAAERIQALDASQQEVNARHQAVVHTTDVEIERLMRDAGILDQVQEQRTHRRESLKKSQEELDEIGQEMDELAAVRKYLLHRGREASHELEKPPETLSVGPTEDVLEDDKKKNMPSEGVSRGGVE
jgi:chromosome segregation ATPase